MTREPHSICKYLWLWHLVAMEMCVCKAFLASTNLHKIKSIIGHFWLICIQMYSTLPIISVQILLSLFGLYINLQHFYRFQLQVMLHLLIVNVIRWCLAYYALAYPTVSVVYMYLMWQKIFLLYWWLVHKPSNL